MKRIEYDEATFPKKGDLVRIRTIDEVKKLYSEDLYTIRYSPDHGFPNHYVKESENERVPFEYIPLYFASTKQIEFNYIYFTFDKNDERKISNMRGQVQSISDGKARVRLFGNKHYSPGNWMFPIEFLEVVEQEYAKNKLSKMEEKKKMRTEATDYDGVVKEMISKVDKRKMKRILSSCLQIDAKEIVGIDTLLKTWAEAKKDIYLLFDRQLSVTVDNEFELDTGEKKHLFLNLEKKFPAEIYFIFNTFSYESDVFPNIVTGRSYGYSYLKKFFPNIQKGMKFTQLMHEVYQNEKFDTALSEFYNMTKIKGCITISIDPIEYMLMSLNDSGWSSCHTLHQKGEGRVTYGCYSAGIFSYMCDDASIIAFRHKNEESEIVVNRTKIKAFSKSWRQMIYLNLDEKSFICSRQYPGKNVVAEKMVRDMLEEILSNKFGLTNVWKIKRDKYDIQKYITDEMLPEYEYDEDEYDPTPLHYNDVLNGFDCTMVYNKQLNNINDVIIKIGSYPVCPICGESRLDDHERPVCYGCYENYLD